MSTVQFNASERRERPRSHARMVYLAAIIVGLLVLCGPIGWKIIQRRALIQKIESQGGEVKRSQVEAYREWGIPEDWCAAIDPVDELIAPKGLSDVELSRLSYFSSLKYLCIHDSHITANHIYAWHRLRKLEVVLLCDCTFEPNAFEAMAKLDSLTHLNLDGSIDLDRDYTFLAKLPKLEHLYLGSSKTSQYITLSRLRDRLGKWGLRKHDLRVSADHINAWSSVCVLEELSLRNCKIEPDAFVAMSKLESLTQLDLTGTNISEPDLQFLPKLAKLELVHVSKTEVAGGEIANFRRLLAYAKEIWIFEKFDSPVMACDIEAWGRLRWLEAISLPRCKIEPDAFLAMAKLDSLVGLLLSGTNVTDQDLAFLKNLTKLKLLDLSDTAVADLPELGRLMALEALNLTGSKTTGAGLAEVRNLTNLKALILDGMRVTDQGLESISNHHDLHELSLVNTAITDAGLTNLKALNKVQWLNLEGTKITDEGVQHLIALKSLMVLNLSKTAITDAGLTNLKALNKVQRLNLEGTKITDEGVQHLIAMPSLKLIEIMGTAVTKNGRTTLRAKFGGRIFW